MPPATVADLLAALRTHRLLTPEQLDALAKEALPVDVRALARALVQRGWLTPFHVNEVFLGRGAKLLLGSYVLLEMLGEGGMGAVYKARNWKLGQTVALKLVRKERLANPAAVKRFYREIRAAAKLEHPNIVRAFDAGEANGTHFFVMEFVSGQDLNKLVKTHGPLDVRTACEYVRQTALGLQHSHEQRMVHRDIKPHNLLLQVADCKSQIDGRHATGKSAISNLQSEIIKILDMGLARIDTDADGEHSSTMTQEGTVVGTPDYIAPEQGLDSHSVDIRADLYSLGCTLYFLLTGRPPFPGGTFMEKLLKHQQQTPAPLRQLRGDVPAEVEALVARLMAKRPDERYATPADLVHDLDAVLSGSMPTLPSAVTMTIPADEVVPAPNVFAEAVQSSATQAVTSGIVKRPPLVAAQAGDGRALRLGLVSAGVLIIAVLLIVTVRSLLSNRKPPEPEPVADAPVKKKPGPSLAEIAAAQDRERIEDERKRKEAEDKRIAEEEAYQALRAKEAEAPFKALQARFAEKDVTFASFAKEVAAFKAKHGGTPAAIRAAEMLMKLPSPLDQLDARKLPEDCVAAWRAAGRAHPDELVGVLGEHRGRHWAPVRSVAYNPKGDVLAATGNDGWVILWDPVTRIVRRQFKSHDRIVHAVAFSPDGRTLATGSDDGSCKLWDAATLQVRHTLSSPGAGVVSLSFSKDGQFIATGSKGVVRIWDVAGGKEFRVLKLSADWTHVAFSPDGRLALRSSDGLRLWDLKAGQQSRRLEKELAGGFRPPVFSSDGTLMAFTDPAGALRLSEVDTGQVRWREAATGGTPELYTMMAYCPKDRYLASVTPDSRIKIWDAASGKVLHTLTGHTGGIDGLAFSPDGQSLASGAWDGTVRVWEVESGKEVRPLTGHTSHVWSVAFSPDGETLASGSGDHAIKLWDPHTGGELRTLKGNDHAVRAVAFSPDGKTLASGGEDSTVKLWDPAAGTELRTMKNARSVLSVDYSLDGKAVASGSSRGVVKLWDPAAGSELRTWQHNTVQVYSVAFRPDGKTFASASHDGTVKLWDPTMDDELRTLTGHTAQVVSVAFSPDGKSLASGSHDFTVKLWYPAAGSELRTLTGHSSYVQSVAFGPDGKTLVSASFDGRIIFRELATGAHLHEWQLPGTVLAVAFAADGRHLATANGNGTVYILRLPREILDDGFAPLFNGKDLTGWKVLPGQTLDWSVRDGILSSGGKIAPQYLFTERGDFKDFHLRGEAKVARQDNTGVFFRLPFADPVRSPGHGAQLGLPNIFNRGPAMTRVWQYSKPTPLDQWMVFEVIARGKQFTVKFNSEAVVDVSDPDAVVTPGHIALEQYAPGTHVQFRKIEIMEFPAPFGKDQ
ncbi:MAG: protein kinase [Gemmataceae bacterium]|nr:protein kinase [Gemmataceae bacterium]